MTKLYWKPQNWKQIQNQFAGVKKIIIQTWNVYLFMCREKDELNEMKSK